MVCDLPRLDDIGILCPTLPRLFHDLDTILTIHQPSKLLYFLVRSPCRRREFAEEIFSWVALLTNVSEGEMVNWENVVLT
jgi:hypothetical protein